MKFQHDAKSILELQQIPETKKLVPKQRNIRHQNIYMAQHKHFDIICMN